MDEILIGKVTHFFPRPMVAAVAIASGTVAVGDAVHFLGRTTDLHHRIDSLQIEHQSVDRAGKGDLVGIKVGARVREHDKVYKVKEAGS
jgi:putative protease